MAATVSAWGKPGAWALDSEEDSPTPLHLNKDDSSAAKGKPNDAETADFPSLAAAVTTKTKKKKGQTLSLQQFSAYDAKPATEPKGLTTDELLMLPTGPRQRSAEELDRNRLGGGFRSYGGGIRDEQSRNQRSFNREPNHEFAPSRADETDDWGAGKKFSSISGFDRKERGERGGFFTDSQSRADEVDNWASNKSFVPTEPKRIERRIGFGFESSNVGVDSNSWVKRKEEDGRKAGGAFDSLRERRGGFESNGVDSESWGRKREEGIVAPRPRLNLQPRTLPLDQVQRGEIGNAAKPKSSSPFGEARPREEVLKEKGQDWKEIEGKLESVKIKETTTLATTRDLTVKKSFWGGSVEEKLPEDKTDRSWRKLESASSLPQSPDPEETKILPAEESETGNDEVSDKRDPQI